MYRFLLAAGLLILAVDLAEDRRIWCAAVEGRWSAQHLRMVGGHALREILVVGALLAVATKSTFLLPFLAGAAVHGLIIRSGYFVGAQGCFLATPYTAFVFLDVGWRGTCLYSFWERRGELFGGN